MTRTVKMLLAGVLALGLAACSSNSGVKRERDAALDDVMALQGQIDKAVTDLRAAGAAGATLAELVTDAMTKIMQGSTDSAAITKAVMDLTAAGATGTTLAELVTDAMTKITQGTAASGTIAKALTDLTAAGAVGTDLAAAVMSAVMMLEEMQQPTGPGVAAADMALAMAIGGAELPTTAFNDGDDTPAGTPEDQTDTIASAKPSDTEFATSTESIATIPGWTGNAYSRMNDAVAADVGNNVEAAPASTDLVVIYDSKGQPTPTPFAMIDPGTTDAEDIFALNRDTDDVATTSEAVTVVNSGTGNHLSYITGLRPANGITRTYSDEDTVMGTLQGAAGTFTCAAGTGNTCQAAVTPDGSDFTLTSVWYFTPDAGAMRQVPNADYMWFGFWKNTSDDDDMTVDVEAIFGSSMTGSVHSGAVDALHGTASYSGMATGKYVRKAFSPDGDVEHLWGGQFTADANLSVAFGGNTIPEADRLMVEGNITDFMDGDGQEIDSGWTVKLQAAALTAATGGESIFEGMTEGDASADAGNYQGGLYGTATAGATGVPQVIPAGIAGEFNGHFTNGHVLGGFAATKDE